jgi:rSAM/selenodomain-associated transferase 1
MERNALIILVKYPRKGQVKTRLGSGIGFENARQLYSCFVLDTLEAISSTKNAVRIAYDPPEAARSVEEWLGPDYGYFPQEGEDFGMRLQDAFRKTFAEGFENAVLIATDCPDIKMETIDEGFRRLKWTDSVIGPSPDGGYYLIGFKAQSFVPAAFENIPWGTADVCNKTLSTLKQAGLHPHILPQWRDIDTAADLADLIRMHCNSPFRESKTMRFLLSRPELRRKLKGVVNN